MKVYKIKHKPTGLYFTPSKGHGNLSTKGKIYSMRPQIHHWLAGGIRLLVRRSDSGKFSKKNQLIIDHFGIQFKETQWRVDERFYTPYED